MQKILQLTLLSVISLSSLASLSACTSKADTIITNQTKILQSDPSNVSALIERGNAFREKGDYAEALVDYNKAIQTSPDSARAYLGRGINYLALNQYENALTDFNKTIALNPEQNEAYARRGEARVKLQTGYSEALADFEKAIALGYTNPDLYRYRGQAYIRLGQKDQAIEAYLKSAGLTGINANSNISDIRVSSSQLDALNEAVDLGLKDIRLYLLRGKLRRLDKRYDGAIDDFTQAIQINPELTEAYEERADAYFSDGQCTRAEQDLQSACKINNRRLCEAIQLGCTVTPVVSASP